MRSEGVYIKIGVLVALKASASILYRAVKGFCGINRMPCLSYLFLGDKCSRVKDGAASPR